MIPKAELHLHLEGAILPSTARQLAKRNKMTLPEEIFGPNESYTWHDFADFLKIYECVAKIIQTAEDFRYVTYAYLEHLAKAGTIYAELTVSPKLAEKNGIPYRQLTENIALAIDEAKENFGIEARIIMSGIRHFGTESVEDVANKIANNPHPYVVGFGLGGNEIDFPPKLFEKAYKIIHNTGLGCTAHAGEMAGPKFIRDAIKYLQVSRIGHGVRAIEDPELIQEIVAREITLEVCPTSNVVLGLYPNYQHHPFNQLRQAGVKTTLNSDDPFFFASQLEHEYEIAKTEFGLKDAELIAITKIAIENSFAENKLKKSLLAKLI
jgi:adenosine deaminase